MDLKWNVLSKYDEKEPVVEVLLKNRSIKNVEEFLNPLSITEYFNKFNKDFKISLKLAKELVDKSIKDGLKIIIYGDYDSDGINATAILYNTLFKEMKYENVEYFIPNRFEDGYGMSRKALEKILKNVKDPILFITVDSGITAVDEIKYLKNLGHFVIITDHHQKPNVLPKADVVVWNDEIVGACVSWILSKILGSKDSQSVAFASLGTVTDLYPLVGFNRALVKKGLEVLNTNPPIGIKKLLEVAGKDGYELSTYDLGWVIGPRINASGRLEDASESLKLFIEEDEKVLEKIANDLNKINFERQEKTLQMFDIASEYEEKDLPRVILSSSEDYHEGIIGLVAAKLVQKYHRPSVVIGIENGVGKGSVRSIPGVNIIEYLREFENMFESLGGHPMAAGFSIKEKNIEKLEKKMLKISKKKIPDELLVPCLDIDMDIPVKIVNFDLFNDIERLKPFGLGNNNPVFVSKELDVSDVSRVGVDKKHLKISFFKEDVYYKGIFFNAYEKFDSLKVGDAVDVVYSLKKNDFNGKSNIDLIIKDIRKVKND